MSTQLPTGPADGDALVVHLAAQLDAHAGRTEAASGELATAALPAELRAASAWDGPPPALREVVFEAVQALAEGGDGAEVVALTRPSRRPAGIRLAWAIPAAAVAAVLLSVGVLGAERALEPDGTTFAAASTALAPGASGEVTVLGTGSGFSLVVEADGLPAAAAGSYYAAWLRGPKGVVPLGSFHERRTGWPVELWSGVDPVAYPTFEVTLQAEGAAPAPSSRVVLTASLSG